MPTPRLTLPYIETQQAQKEVTHNVALNRLDALTQLVIEDRDLATPPASPVEGRVYIVASSASGVWVGQEGKLAQFIGGVWQFYAPATGWQGWLKDEKIQVFYTGSSWARVSTQAPWLLPSYTVATLPTATAGSMIYVSDESGGAVVAFADGTNWRRVTDRVVVS